MTKKNVSFKNNISGNLKYLRTRKDLKQEEVAYFLGITRSAYANYEQGRRIPDLDTIIKIADFYDTDIDFIIGEDNKSKIYEMESNKIISNMSEQKKVAVTELLDIMNELSELENFQILDYATFLQKNKEKNKEDI